MKSAIMGFGNPVRSDDGVGCYVVEKLRSKIGTNNTISIFDMGTSAFEVLFQLKGHDNIIIVDGVINSDHPDGTIFRMPASEINASIQEDPMVFLHSLKWDQALSYAKKIMQNEFPSDKISVYLVSITNTKLDVGLSSTIQTAGDKVVDFIISELNSI
jgi:hydrogenase maturation protease